MKTEQTIHELATTDRAAWFKHREQLQSDLATLVQVYEANDRPKATVEEFIKPTSYERALEVIASLVNTFSGDGRICREVKAWAAAQPASWDYAAAIRIGIATDAIHPAHINQIGRALMDYQE